MGQVISKRNIIFLEILLFVVVIIGVVVDYYMSHSGCKGFHVGYCNNLEGVVSVSAQLTFVLAYIFPFSLITYFLHDRVFQAWAWFAIVWIPILLIVPNFFDRWNGNFGLSDAGGAFFLLSVGYVFFSILIILIQSLRVYWLKRS